MYLNTVVPIYISEVMFIIILKYMLESKTSYISSIVCRLGSQLDPRIFSKSLVATYEYLTTHTIYQYKVNSLSLSSSPFMKVHSPEYGTLLLP